MFVSHFIIPIFSKEIEIWPALRRKFIEKLTINVSYVTEGAKIRSNERISLAPIILSTIKLHEALWHYALVWLLTISNHVGARPTVRPLSIDV